MQQPRGAGDSKESNGHYERGHGKVALLWGGEEASTSFRSPPGPVGLEARGHTRLARAVKAREDRCRSGHLDQSPF